MSIEEELIAATKNNEEIKNAINADFLLYQKTEDLYKAINKSNLCTACFNGDYPTKISKELLKIIGEDRIKHKQKSL